MPLAARRTQGPEDLRLITRRIALCCLLAWPVAGQAENAHPLLEFARERQPKVTGPRVAPLSSGVRESQHALEQARVPPAAECAASVGAARFAELHADLAAALSGAGDFARAAEAYRNSLACRPRSAELQAALAGVLFDARDYAGARAAIETALALDGRSVSSNRLAGNLDFVEQRWANAVARFRYVAASDLDRQQASYGQLMFWLAQARAGVAHPEYVERTPAEGWPQPLLLYLRGEYTEAELLKPIKAGDDADNSQPNTSTDERLCEALYYVGEAYWARGEPKVALDYFTAVVNLRVIYFLEHGLALAEIAKLR
jgi:lipoprotein NlpI